MGINAFELSAFILYFLAVIGIGLFFFMKSKNRGEKDYFLGGRQMNGIVAAFSAGASDMSAWVLMGLPGSIFLYGLGQVWISIGLFIGTVCAWIFVAPRLRRYAIAADDSITIPGFLSARFKAKTPTLRIVAAVIFVIAYCLYSASSISACGELFVTLFGLDASKKTLIMAIAALIVVCYTLLGGFNAVCWTDFIQGMLMLVALMVVPIIALFMVQSGTNFGEVVTGENYYNLLSSGKFDWASISDILTGLGWGLGYFGMPHILVRYMSIKSEREMKKSQIIGSVWTGIILTMATVLGLVAHEFLGDSVGAADKNLIFVVMTRKIFGFGVVAFIAGLLISAIIAASMSTADSQLLASSSAFSSDIYKTTIRKDASDKELLLVGRITVIAITIIAFFIAVTPKLSGIMELVSAAWSLFGAAFGPAIILSLYWKRLTYKGTVSGIIAGFVTTIFWMVFFNFEYYGFTSIVSYTNLYEIIPGFLVGLAVAVIVSLFDKEPDADVLATFELAKKKTED